MKPRHIFFDVGNVLVRFNRSETLARVAEAVGKPLAALEKQLQGKEVLAKLEKGLLDWPSACAILEARLGRRVDPSLAGEAYCSGFSLIHGMIPLLAGIERFGCRIGILSNTSAIHWEHLTARRFGLVPGSMNPVVLSYQEGHLKPEPEIFDIAARRAGVQPSGIFFTDDIPENVEAARRAGWDAEVFRSPQELARDLECRGLDIGI